MSPRVLVAMSGGVDSSVAAARLVEQGYDVVGATMKLFCYGESVPDRPCCSLDSINDARDVAHTLGVPHYVLNLEDRFALHVIRNFVDEYSRGRTPIPCVRCNSFTKFRDLLAHADALGCSHIATGHYAVARDGALFRARDLGKDQTYFLWGIDRAVVNRMLTPVGELNKQETRAYARRMGLRTADKPESVEICFVPNDDYAAVLEQHLPADAPALSPGAFVTSDGTVLGEHRGYGRFTVGQRKGLPGGADGPRYVIAIRPESREVVVGGTEELGRDGVRLEEVNWLADRLDAGARCHVQLRYRSPAISATVASVQDGGLELRLDHCARAVAPGQSGVLYEESGRVLGGGVIS
jgi:tRNA-specific 2-thiouridylase